MTFVSPVEADGEEELKVQKQPVKNEHRKPRSNWKRTGLVSAAPDALWDRSDTLVL